MNRYREGFSEREELILWAMAAGFMAADPSVTPAEALARAAAAYVDTSEALDGGEKIPLPDGWRWLQRGCGDSPGLLGLTDDPPTDER